MHYYVNVILLLLLLLLLLLILIIIITTNDTHNCHAKAIHSSCNSDATLSSARASSPTRDVALQVERSLVSASRVLSQDHEVGFWLNKHTTTYYAMLCYPMQRRH